jgi:Cof subfamily protein (haloacid dehalogenase superfamily)
VGPEGELRPRDRRAIKELEKRGIPVTLCTGRMFTGTQPVALDLGLDAPLACVDGSHVAASLTGKDLACATLDESALELLFGILVEHGATPFAFSSEHLFHDDAGHPYLDYVRTWSRRTRLVPDLLGKAGWSATQSVPAVLALAREDRIREAELALRSRAAQALQCVSFESLTLQDESGRRPWALLVRAAGYNKGTAVEWLARHYRVELEEVVAVGDWLNDVPMFEKVGLAFAMGQAPEQVRAAADEVLEADDERGGGIAEAAERAGLL